MSDTTEAVARPRPRFGKILDAMTYSGIGRSKLYELAGEHRGLFRKSGEATLVDYNLLDTLLDALPVAEITKTQRMRASLNRTKRAGGSAERGRQDLA
jgi:hypothetical protein